MSILSLKNLKGHGATISMKTDTSGQRRGRSPGTREGQGENPEFDVVLVEGTFQALKDNNSCQPRLLYPVKPFIIIEGERKTFYDKARLKEFMTTKLTQEVFEVIL